MKSILLIFLFILSCSTPKAFHSPTELLSMDMQHCGKIFRPYMVDKNQIMFESGVKPGFIYYAWHNSKKNEIHLYIFGSPGFNWTEEPNFHEFKYLGYCKVESDSKSKNVYFLIFMKSAKGSDDENPS